MDKEFTLDELDKSIALYYNKLRKGGTLIVFIDIWKITTLKDIMEKHKFKQLRFIEWIKTNPQPLNSKTNYLTKLPEVALLGVKGGKPTFNSRYDNAQFVSFLYKEVGSFPSYTKELVAIRRVDKKHSNEGDLVLDTFLGAGTTALASKNLNRRFKGCEISKEYYDNLLNVLEVI